MAKRHLLTFLALMFCFSAFSQQSQELEGQGTELNPFLIQSVEDFNYFRQSGDKYKYYKQTADIDLEVFTQNAAIIPTFSGTYDGNGYSITYQASFTATNSDAKLGLFGTVTGTIKNLNLTNCSMTCSMTAEGQNNTFVGIGLLCGYLDGSSNAVSITDCNVINGTINSTISTAQWYARVATGLIAGKVKNGIIKYSSATGSVTGCGYVGGLIGQTENGDVVGSSFVGTASATFDSGNWWADLGSNATGTGRGPYVGGIIGFADNSSSINLCYVKADIEVEETILQLLWWEWDMYAGSGLGSTTNDGMAQGDQTGTPLVTNSYAEGTINGEPIEDKGDLTNSANSNNSNNYYEGATAQGCSTQQTTAECIADKLNDAVPEADKNKIQFSVSDDDNVIFGVVIDEDEICGVPTNLVVSNNEGTCTATWNPATEVEGIIVANTWKYMLSGGDLSQVYHGTTTNNTLSSPLPASQNPYTFTVYTDCSETVNGLTSDAVSQTFTVPCPIPTNLTASKITDNGFTISWTANVDCQVSLYENEEILVGNEEIILSNQEKKKLFEGLNPETQYTVIVKAKCGNEYVEQASINVTTARLAAPTGLTVTPIWQSTSGKIVVTWNMVAGLTYEIEGEAGDKVSGFEKTELSVGAYTLKLRAKKGEKTSEWVSMPYTISNPEAPKNPEVTYNQHEGSFNVEINWQQGVEGEVTWFVAENTADLEGASISKPYVLTEQQAGETFSILIKEKSNNGQNVSQALVVPIQVPCLQASEPTSIVPALNSVTFNFDDAKTRKIVIGSTEYEANNASVTINGLTEGTSYAYEIREYCNVVTNTYSSIDSTFSTLACYAVAGLSVSNVELTTATVSWTSQSSIDGLKYKIVVNGIEKPVQTNTTINLEGLRQSTEYTVEVYEQCGAVGNWGAVSSITFTTKGTKNYISATSGDFTTGTTWIGGKAPNSADEAGTTITISQGHTLTLSSTFIITDNYTISNKGVLVIQQGGELINKTDNNVGGIIEVVTPVKQNGSWTFIGAPFENIRAPFEKYKLETIKPVSGSDISISLYDYEAKNWSDEWALYDEEVGTGEGYFAWPFYDGAVTYTTYGDLFVWNAEGTSGTIMTSYDFSQPAKYQLNNAETFTITKENLQGNASTGRWMALSNPYPAKLSVDKFVAANTNIASGTEGRIQGKCIYKLTNNVSSNKQTWDVVFANNANETVKDIAMTEGFFVNLASGNQVTFSKDQLTNYTTQAKSQVAPREFVELSLVKGNYKSKLYFAHNQEAEQNYDIFDANKMFSPVEIAEPYFVTEGIALVKEEVKELPYYATMNVRSFANDTISFVVENIPEGISVFLIDNEEEIKMSEDVAYTTHISEGENADRFQVLFKKASVIEDAKDSEITITNTNRLVRVESTQTDLRIEVYNALGQKVFATNDYNFTLNEVSAGTYMIKAYNRITTQTAKIVIH